MSPRMVVWQSMACNTTSQYVRGKCSIYYGLATRQREKGVADTVHIKLLQMQLWSDQDPIKDDILFQSGRLIMMDLNIYFAFTPLYFSVVIEYLCQQHRLQLTVHTVYHGLHQV